jgi:hypothetical protein
MAQNRAVAAQRTIMIWIGAVFLGLLVLVNIVVFMFCKRNAATTPTALPTSTA